MTGIFKANNPSNNAILFVYGVVLKLPLFFHPQAPQSRPEDGILYKGFLKLLEPVTAAFPAAPSLISFALLFIQAVSFNNILNRQRMFRQPTYLAGMSYLLITSLFKEWYILSAPMIVNTLLIWIFGRLCTLYNNSHPKATIFNAGLAAGICSFFYWPSIAYVLLIMTGITIARPTKLQEWLTGLAGIVTPLYFFAAWLFLSDSWKTFHLPGLSINYPHFFGNRLSYIALGILIITVITGLRFLNLNFRRQVVQTRKSWQLLFLYLVVSAFVPFLNAGTNFSYWILLAVPLAGISAAAFFYPNKRIIPLLLHWAMAAICVAFAFGF